jgi:hypothetical protein
MEEMRPPGLGKEYQVWGGQEKAETPANSAELETAVS